MRFLLVKRKIGIATTQTARPTPIPRPVSDQSPRCRQKEGRPIPKAISDIGNEGTSKYFNGDRLYIRRRYRRMMLARIVQTEQREIPSPTVHPSQLSILSIRTIQQGRQAQQHRTALFSPTHTARAVLCSGIKLPDSRTNGRSDCLQPLLGLRSCSTPIGVLPTRLWQRSYHPGEREATESLLRDKVRGQPGSCR